MMMMIIIIIVMCGGLTVASQEGASQSRASSVGYVDRRYKAIYRTSTCTRIITTRAPSLPPLRLSLSLSPDPHVFDGERRRRRRIDHHDDGDGDDEGMCGRSVYWIP